jgi:predicted nucleic acid-binding Zn ribbon protein
MSESASNTKNSRNSNRVLPHKHCKICQEAIPTKTEPRVCNKEECITKNEKNEKSQKQVRILMLVFFGIFALPFIASIVLQVAG